MSRIGKLPIVIPAGTEVRLDNGWIVVKGAKGELKKMLHPAVKLGLGENEITVTVENEHDKKNKALWGLWRNLIQNLVIGVNQGYTKKLEINGVGYRANVQGKKVVLSVGFSHPVDFNLPEGISAQVDGNEITVSGNDKELVGETAARLRRIKPPEPYKGKGIKYSDEVIRRKAGKAAGKGAEK